MPFPFVPGEVLTSANLNAALNQRMMADGTGYAFPPGAILFGATTGGFATDSVNLFFNDTNDRLGIQTNTPQAMLQVGKTAATARSYNSYVDAANGEWGYLGDWSKTVGVVTYGSDKNGSGVVRDVSFVYGGVEQMRLATSGVNIVVGMVASTLGLGGAGVGAAGNPLDIRRDFDGLTTVTVTNASTGLGAQTRAIYSNDAATGQLMLGVMGTLATTNGVFLQDGAYISAEAGLAGGLNLMTRAAAPIRFATNGQANERMQITSAGLVTFGGITNAFPALKRNAAALEIRLADDSAYGNLTAGFLGLNGQVATMPLDIRNTFTSLTEVNIVSVTATLRASSTFFQWGVWFSPTIQPTGASLSLAAAVGVSNSLAGTVAIQQASALWIRNDLTNYTGANLSYADGLSISDNVGGSATKYAVQNTGIRIVAAVNGHGATLATGVANIGVQVDGATSGAGAGGLLINRCIGLNIPSGSGAGTTNNSGIYIGGNGGSGGGGATTNYAILSDSTALSVVASLRVGNSTGTGNPTNATAPMLYITAVNGQPTATPIYNASGAVAIQFDTTNKKLWAFDTATNTWKGVVLA